MQEMFNEALMTHSNLLNLAKDISEILFSLIALLIVRRMVYIDYKNPQDWKVLSIKAGDFKSVSRYHCCVYAFSAVLFAFIHF